MRQEEMAAAKERFLGSREASVKLGRSRVMLDELSAWLLWRLGGVATGVEVLVGEGGGTVDVVSFKLARGAGFVQEEIDRVVWWGLSPAMQIADARRILLDLERRVRDVERSGSGPGAGRGGVSAGSDGGGSGAGGSEVAKADAR